MTLLPSIMILFFMLLVGILIAVALLHLYPVHPNPEGGHDAESYDLRRKGLLRPYR